MTRERNDAGQYADGIDPDTVADVFDARDDLARPVTATDVVDELGIARRTAHNKLNALVERGELETRKIGARGRVWWRPIPAEGRGFDADGLRGDPTTTLDGTGDEHAATTPGATDATETTADDRDAESGRTRDESDTLIDDARDRIDRLDLAGTGTDYERRQDAVLEMYAYLRDRPGERVSKGDFEALLDGMDVGYKGGFSSLWSNWVKGSGDRPNALDILPGVELQGNDYVFRPEGGR